METHARISHLILEEDDTKKRGRRKVRNIPMIEGMMNRKSAENYRVCADIPKQECASCPAKWSPLFKPCYSRLVSHLPTESACQPRSARLLLHGHSSTYPGCCKCQVYGGITKQSIANVNAKDFDKLLPSIISFTQCGYHPPVPQNPPKESSWGSMES